jgi:hypothetical protein
LREGTRVDGLDHEDALQQPAVHQRYAEEGVVGIFAGLAEVLEARMPHGVGHHERLELLGDQSGQPLRRAHAHAPDTLWPQPHGSRQDEIGPVGLEKVDGAHIRIEPRLDQMDDVVQRLGRVAAAGGETADLFERPERRAFVCGDGGLLFGVERSGAARMLPGWQGAAAVFPAECRSGHCRTGRCCVERRVVPTFS